MFGTHTLSRAGKLVVLGLALLASACSSESEDDKSPPTTLFVGETIDATLIVDSEECRSEGRVDGFDRTWSLVDPAPIEWKDLSTIDGTLTPIDNQNATFSSDRVDLRVMEFPRYVRHLILEE